MRPNFLSFLKIVFLLTLILTLGSSCRKFVQIEPSPNLIQTSELFLSEGTALSAVSGVYVQLRANNFLYTNGGLSLYGGLAADELYATSPTSTTEPFYSNQLTPTNSTVRTFFYNLAYQLVYRANSILEGLAASTSLSDSVRQQLTGEMKVVRALQYFYLLNLYGDVPLILTTDYRINAVAPRAAREKVYDQIIADLTVAQSLLKPAYPSTGKVRPNSFTATALLARVYLYTQNWAKAEEEASRVIDSKRYSLAPLTGVFLKNSSETIWEVASPNELSATGDAVFFIPSTRTTRPTYALTPSLLSAFEPGDLRRGSTGWIDSNKVGGTSYYYPKKYGQRTVSSGNLPLEYEVVLRLGEQYLIRSEARAKTSNLTGALEDLNTIRKRAGLSNVTGAGDVVLNAITKERRVELFAEWGHRWLDLKRTGQSDAVLAPLKGATWQSTDVLWPIPEAELLANPYLSQNPGY